MENKKTVMDEGFGEEEEPIEPETDQTLIEDGAVEVVEKEPPQPKELSASQEDTIENRRSALLDKDSWIVDYDFDVEKSLHCRLTLSVCDPGCFYVIYVIILSIGLNFKMCFSGTTESGQSRHVLRVEKVGRGGRRSPRSRHKKSVRRDSEIGGGRHRYQNRRRQHQRHVRVRQYSGFEPALL